MDLLDRLIGTLLRSDDIVAQSNHGQHAAAVRDDAAPDTSRACVENFHVGSDDFIETFYRITFCIAHWITTGRHHHRKCDARIPTLIKAFTQAGTLEERKKISADIQAVAYELTPSVMWGQFTIPAGYRSDLKNLIQSDYPMFWEVDR